MTFARGSKQGLMVMREFAGCWASMRSISRLALQHQCPRVTPSITIARITSNFKQKKSVSHQNTYSSNMTHCGRKLFLQLVPDKYRDHTHGPYDQFLQAATYQPDTALLDPRDDHQVQKLCTSAASCRNHSTSRGGEDPTQESKPLLRV